MKENNEDSFSFHEKEELQIRIHSRKKIKKNTHTNEKHENTNIIHNRDFLFMRFFVNTKVRDLENSCLNINSKTHKKRKSFHSNLYYIRPSKSHQKHLIFLKNVMRYCDIIIRLFLEYSSIGIL